MTRARISRKKRAIVGIEAAIVLIAFVIVASALAFVALNMGFYTTQKSKEVISTGLGEASSALEIDGTILAYTGNTTSTGSDINGTLTGSVTAIAIPIRLAPGKEPVDLTPNKTTVSFWYMDPKDGSRAYENLYSKAAAAVVPAPSEDLRDLIKYTVVDVYNVSSGSSITGAAIYWISKVNKDKVLDYGEKILLIIVLSSSDWLNPYSTFKVEVKPPVGAALTVARSVPPSITSTYVDLG